MEENTQLILTDEVESDVAVSMNSAVTEVQVNAEYMSSFERFSAIEAHVTSTRFGNRVVVSARVPDDPAVYVFTLTLPDGESKTAKERRAIVDFFTQHPHARIDDCCLVAVPTDFGQPAYLWRSVDQAKIMKQQQAMRETQAGQQQVERAAGLRGPARRSPITDEDTIPL